MSEHPAGPRSDRHDNPETRALRLAWIRETWRRAALRFGFDEAALQSIEDAPEPRPSSIPLRARTLPDTLRLAPDLASGIARAHVALGPDPDAPARSFAIDKCFRDTKPLPARSAEFTSWRCQIFGDPSVRAEAEVIACAVAALRDAGLAPAHAKVRISHRSAVESLLVRRGVAREHLDAWFPLLHRAGRMSNDDFVSEALTLGMEARTAVDVLRVLAMSTPFEAPTTQLFLSEQAGGRGPEYFKSLFVELRALGVAEWCVLNLGIARPGPHDTGMVFEIHDAAGRAHSIAAGGRSDALVESVGGPAVPSVGFEMSDTALLRLLADQSLLPDPAALARFLGRRADVFVACVNDDDCLGACPGVVASLRAAGLHARSGAIIALNLDDAETLARAASSGAGARHVVLISPHPDGPAATSRNTDTGHTHPGPIPLSQLAALFTH